MGNIKEVFDTRAITPIYHSRACGNSTRQADAAIQELFNGKIVKVVDHSELGIANKRLFKIILNRLDYEHNLTMMRNLGYIRVDSNHFTIELTEQYDTASKLAVEVANRQRDFMFNKKDDN